MLLHGEPGEVEFVVDGLVGDPEMDWYVEDGPGVMIREPKFFGSVFLRNSENMEDLVLVSRSKP